MVCLSVSTTFVEGDGVPLISFVHEWVKIQPLADILRQRKDFLGAGNSLSDIRSRRWLIVMQTGLGNSTRVLWSINQRPSIV